MKLVNKNDSLDLTGYRTGGQWYVIDTEVQQQTQYETVDEYTSLVFIMYLRRKPLYYVFNLVLPSVILAMLALLVFILPPEAGEKMSLGITVLLSFTVFQLLVADSMPKTSEYIPVIGELTMLQKRLNVPLIAYFSLNVTSVVRHNWS